jgi:hypothetical protein
MADAVFAGTAGTAASFEQAATSKMQHTVVKVNIFFINLFSWLKINIS